MSEAMNYRLGFDIGGTFTDFVLVDERSGRTHLNKCLTTPDDPSRGVMDGLGMMLRDSGVAGEEIDIAIHGTTLITNALIERKGARIAMLATAGFRDVLEMGTEVRYDVYDLFLEKPAPLVPRKWRFDVMERLDRDGNVLTELDEASVRETAAEMRRQEIEAVAIVFLHSFRNPAHEQRARDILTEELPDVSTCVSSAVAPEIREFERMSTTVANSYVQPLTRHYIDVIEHQLKDMGYGQRLFLMISSGGIATSETAKEFPIRMVESGPAAGVLAATYYGRSMGLDSLVTFDMGGTTAKIGLVKNHQATKASVIEVGRVKRFKKGSGIPIRVPVVELIEIGAGGGSIAHVDLLGLLKVGPESAGADPGPACYGRGGRKPTVTDADVILGYLDPDYFLGGTMKLDVEAARKAVEDELSKPLGMPTHDAARGIFEVVNQSMLAAMKVHIAERGEDPRKFYLFSFGGAGPAHAYELARTLRMKGIVVPPGAGGTSAMGLVTTAVSFDFARSFVARLDAVRWDEVRIVFEDMAAEGLAILADARIASDSDGVTVVHSMDLRHKGQGHEVSVVIPKEVYDLGSTEALTELFYDRHREEYGHAHTHLAVEMVTCRTVVAAPPPVVPLHRAESSASDPEAARKGLRPVFFPENGAYRDTPVYDRYRLAPESSFAGPAIIEERECTVVAGPSSRVSVDAFGSLFIDLLPMASEGRANG